MFGIGAVQDLDTTRPKVLFLLGATTTTANGQKASDDRTRPMSTVLASGIEGAVTDPDNTVQSTSVADLPLLKRRQTGADMGIRRFQTVYS